MSNFVFGNAGTVAAGVLAKQSLYADMILEPIRDRLLDTRISVDYTAEFAGNVGGTLRIPSIGDINVYDHNDGDQLKFDTVDLGSVNLTINQFPQVGHKITNAQLRRGYLVGRGLQMLIAQHQRAIMEKFETDLLAAANSGQTAANANNIKGAAHRLVAQGTGAKAVIEDLERVKYAFEKANMGDDPILGIVTPEFLQDLRTIPNLVNGGLVHPMLESVIRDGAIRGQMITLPFYGMALVVNNRLPVIASETIGSDTVTNGRANIFLNVGGDPNKMALAHMWSLMPEFKMWEDKDFDAIKHATLGEYGVGVVRADGLVTVLGRG